MEWEKCEQEMNLAFWTVEYRKYELVLNHVLNNTRCYDAWWYGIALIPGSMELKTLHFMGGQGVTKCGKKKNEILSFNENIEANERIFIPSTIHDAKCCMNDV